MTRASAVRVTRNLSSGASALQWTVTIVLLVAVPLIGFWSVMTGGRSFFINSDNVEQFYPWYQKMSSAVHHGYLPIWDANVLSGHSFAGEFQTGVFYPVNIAFVGIFGTASGIDVRALDWLVLLHFAVACAATFIVCRLLKFSPLASTIAALLFAYTGPFAMRASAQTCILFGDSLIPVALMFAILFIQRKRIVYSALAGVMVGLGALAGHLEPPAMSGLVVTAVFVHDYFRTNRRRFLMLSLVIMVVSAGVVAAPQVLFGFQYLSDAYRWVGAASPILGTRSLPFDTYIATAYTPDQLLNIIDPWHHSVPDADGLFAGCAPLVLLLLAFATTGSRKEMREKLGPLVGVMVVAAFAFVMLLGRATPIPHLVFLVPLGSAAVREIGRYSILCQLAMALAAGAALDALASSDFRLLSKLLRPMRLIAVGISIALVAFVFSAAPDGLTLSSLLIGLMVFVLFAERFVLRPILISLVVALEIVLSLPSAANFTYASSYPPHSFAPDPLLTVVERCYPECRVSNVGDVYPANIGDVYPVQTTLGHGATMYRPYFDLLGAGGFDPHGFIQDALNVRYVISNVRLTGLKLLASDATSGRFLYQRPSAFPRVFNNDALTAQKLQLNDVVFKTLSYSDLESQYSVTVPRDETVVFSEQFYPGWVVSVDGQANQMLEAGIAGSTPILRAVRVPRGEHIIRFQYPR